MRWSAAAATTMAFRFSCTVRLHGPDQAEGTTVRGFGELEQAIMDVVWVADVPLTVREVLERLNADRPQPLAYNTVQTVLEVLHRKEWLTRAKDGRAFRYEA